MAGVGRRVHGSGRWPLRAEWSRGGCGRSCWASWPACRLAARTRNPLEHRGIFQAGESLAVLVGFPPSRAASSRDASLCRRQVFLLEVQYLLHVLCPPGCLLGCRSRGLFAPPGVDHLEAAVPLDSVQLLPGRLKCPLPAQADPEEKLLAGGRALLDRGQRDGVALLVGGLLGVAARIERRRS